MKVSERLKVAMKEKGITQSELSRESSISKSTLSEWISGKYEPKQDKVFILANALNISPSWLMGLTDTMEAYKDIEPVYSQLDTPRQQKVYDFAQHQLDEQNIDDTQSVYLVGHTAAGLAIDYGQFNIEKIKATVPKGADYAVLVHGDSMEPLIEDGQIIFYREQPIVENGEIAIVELNREEVTCKKFYHEGDKVILKSINPAYDDMVITENIRIIGKVII